MSILETLGCIYGGLGVISVAWRIYDNPETITRPTEVFCYFIAPTPLCYALLFVLDMWDRCFPEKRKEDSYPQTLDRPV